MIMRKTKTKKRKRSIRCVIRTIVYADLIRFELVTVVLFLVCAKC